MRQVWSDLLFAHWPLPADTLGRRLPPGLALDTYDGTAWLGIVPFRMSDVRPRWTRALPWLSHFPELNVRTYVTGPSETGGKPGVFFFSLDAGNPVAVALARRFFHLPYFRAQMTTWIQAGEIQYRSHRTHRGAPAADLVGHYRPTGSVYQAQPDTLEHWLTERYCLYTVDGRDRLLRGEIHHLPWPLQPASATFAINTLAQAHDLAVPDCAPLLHFARRLDVVIWGLENC